MKFGTKVLVTRGSAGRPAGQPGCLRTVRGVVIGAYGKDYRVRLEEDDAFDTVGWRKAGDCGWWGQLSVQPRVDESNQTTLFCPKHGFISEDRITTIKTCGVCMEERGCSANDATILERR